MAYKLIVTIPEIPPAWVRRVLADDGNPADGYELALHVPAEDGLRHMVRGWIAPNRGDEWGYRYDIVHTPDPIKAGECVRYGGSLVNVLAIDGPHAWVRWASFVNGSGFLVDLDKLSPRLLG